MVHLDNDMKRYLHYLLYKYVYFYDLNFHAFTLKNVFTVEILYAVHLRKESGIIMNVCLSDRLSEYKS